MTRELGVMPIQMGFTNKLREMSVLPRVMGSPAHYPRPNLISFSSTIGTKRDIVHRPQMELR
jgi:hypothetical protein